MPPSISIREYIRWLPERASEPTTTLVLTSGGNRFVDIRILEPGHGDRAEEQVGGDVLHSSSVDWAIGGTSSSELRTDTDGKQIVHSAWKHWVDSRYADAESVTDEGDMIPLKDGRTLEKGSMVNPATGHMTDYEECWQDVEPTTTHSEDDKVVCAVLQLHDDDHQARGMVVRVGQFCQGIIRVGDGLSLERWQWDKNGGWRRQVRVGDLWVPCGVLFGGERLKLGGEMKHGDFIWKVVELSDS